MGGFYSSLQQQNDFNINWYMNHTTCSCLAPPLNRNIGRLSGAIMTHKLFRFETDVILLDFPVGRTTI